MIHRSAGRVVVGCGEPVHVERVQVANLSSPLVGASHHMVFRFIYKQHVKNYRADTFNPDLESLGSIYM